MGYGLLGVPRPCTGTELRCQLEVMGRERDHIVSTCTGGAPAGSHLCIPDGHERPWAVSMGLAGIAQGMVQIASDPFSRAGYLPTYTSGFLHWTPKTVIHLN